ncbi:alpha/beta hydrolase fold protein [Neocallimastix lanati (nom. inval.)]|jgi:pimeloyl-ACP methyl ester carboxylesterase|uniref:Alpha/beta hydrolase fold protein n=1 Tax=Neocallimastix californiae TaxID=1754190 RepID=A0A1Y2ESI9_9FUNG|nr:alpha/beta hydrolase fold protein [Neocallimastix sp. JGI-2020a]ORY73815.1 alpha/beta hydrolase fold protein [Neocallimastix californiae]|eukprot:ORY73815.1 alpha/beta hydrolase fold protein [Neocallimastix californiae]
MSDFQIKDGLAYRLYEGQKYKNINVVFIHGTGCNKDFLKAVRTELTDYNVYFFDLPGHGNSEVRAYTKESYLDGISHFIKDLTNVILIGHSLGGTLTVGSLARKPKNVVGGIVAGGALNFDNLPADFLKGVHNGVINKDLVYDGFGHLDHPEVVEAIQAMEPDEVTLKDWLLDEHIDVSDGIEEITVPVKVIVGRDDFLVPVEKSEEIAKRIPNATLIVVNKARHMLIVALKHQIRWLVDEIREEAKLA